MIKVAKLSEIPEDGSKLIEVGGKKIALYRHQGGVYAMDAVCPHAGGPLAEGFVENFQVTCPWHAWQFDIRNGDCLTVPPSRLGSYEVKVLGEDIMLYNMGA